MLLTKLTNFLNDSKLIKRILLIRTEIVILHLDDQKIQNILSHCPTVSSSHQQQTNRYYVNCTRIFRKYKHYYYVFFNEFYKYKYTIHTAITYFSCDKMIKKNTIQFTKYLLVVASGTFLNKLMANKYKYNNKKKSIIV